MMLLVAADCLTLSILHSHRLVVSTCVPVPQYQYYSTTVPVPQYQGRTLLRGSFQSDHHAGTEQVQETYF